MNTVTKEITSQITSVLNQNGPPYSSYRCKQVSWDDVSRYGAGTTNLSCMGSNITDTRLYAKDNRLLYTVRPNNWNEKIGITSSDNIQFVYNNKMVTLTNYLANFPEYAKYALKGSGYTPLGSLNNDTKVSVRFQTTFLPIGEDEKRIQYAPEVYNYGNQNIQLLCTSQGVSVQQGTSGRQKLFHHNVQRSENGVDKIHQYWFEAEPTRFKVGETHAETVEEAKEALERGKSMATTIGLCNDTSPRLNTLMTIQVPIEKQPQTYLRGSRGGYGGGSMKLNSNSSSRGGYGGRGSRMSSYGKHRRKKYGQASAGRVSRGTEHGIWNGITRNNIKRNASQHITVTIVLYHVIENGVPTEEDIKRSIDELEKLYTLCNDSFNLKDEKAEFMSSKHVPLIIPKGYTPEVQSYNPELLNTAASFDNESKTDA